MTEDHRKTVSSNNAVIVSVLIVALLAFLAWFLLASKPTPPVTPLPLSPTPTAVPTGIVVEETTPTDEPTPTATNAPTATPSATVNVNVEL